MPYPLHRMRRLRGQPWLRRAMRETRFSADQLIEPLFVSAVVKDRQPIPSMPGCWQLSLEALVEEARASREAGVGAVILFGIPEAKDATGSGGYAPEGIIPRALRLLKKEIPDLFVIADVCLCEYTDHGHCGIVEGGRLLTEPTLDLLARESVAYAEAGADMVAPSAMADGQVGAIREALDDAGFEELPILSYAAKYASAFYGPFREAAESAPRFGDRRSYQLDPANAREALREVELDLEEGADMVMVKPALPYLDIVRQVADLSPVPVAAYNVSGEFSMLLAAAERGWLDRERAIVEVLTSIKRAGADVILTYHAREAARLAREP